MTLAELQRQIKRATVTKFTDNEVRRFINNGMAKAHRDGNALMHRFEALYGKRRKRIKTVGNFSDGKK